MSENLEQSFVAQLQANQNIIHKICRLYTAGEDAHKDLFQEITIQLWKAYPKFRGDSKFSTWTYRVALNTAITLYRKTKRTISTVDYESHQHFVKDVDYNYEEEEQIKLMGAAGHNLQNVDLTIPLGVMTCVTGVSGSGKSTLINRTLLPLAATQLNGATTLTAEKFDSIDGLQFLDKVVDIDQSPIGRTPRSNPATYTGLFTPIRELFAQTPEAKARGYAAGRFSFNVKGGRCEACEGDGMIKVAMHFLPDMYVPCDNCHGERYNRETLEVGYKGKNISDVLEMTVEDAAEFFSAIPVIHRRLETLHQVGLGYIRLGQSATTLSGGEAQRIKLATELSKKDTGNTFYILDEPTTGLHFEDIRVLMDVINVLVEKGNTVLIIEHNLDVVKLADYVIDIGYEGGKGGGEVVAKGTPEEIVKNKKSYTAQFLKKELS